MLLIFSTNLLSTGSTSPLLKFATRLASELMAFRNFRLTKWRGCIRWKCRSPNSFSSSSMEFANRMVPPSLM
nr:hypothetical protein [Alkalitalea saponilacus]